MTPLLHARPRPPRLALLVGAMVTAAGVFVAAPRSAGQTGPKLIPETSPAAASAAPATAPTTNAADEAAEPPRPPVLTRVYDIRDLIVDIPNFTDGPDLLANDLGRGPQSYAETMWAAPNADGAANICFPSPRRSWGERDIGRTREQVIEDIVRLIQETVQPETWRENGGREGVMKELSGQLIVMQTAENHRALADLLAQFRETQLINVRVRARWVLVPDRAALDKVLKPAAVTGRLPSLLADPTPRGATRPAAAAAPSSRPAGQSSPLLTAASEDLDTLPAALAQYDAEVACLNAQRVTVGSVRNRTATAGVAARLTPTTAGVAPAASPLLSGLMLDVQQTLSADRTTAVLLVRAQWKEAKLDPAAGGTATYRASAATRPASGPAGGDSTATVEASAPVDRRDGRTHEIRTAVRVPVGQMVLVGGATLDPVLPAAGDAGGKSPPRLYLFVEVTAD